MDLLELSSQIVEKYRRYLLTTFYFKDPTLRKSFQESLNAGHLSKGPYLESTPIFKKGKTIEEFFNDTFPGRTDRVSIDAMLGKRVLYLHQEQAINKVFKEKKNIVVATGTGSGKTEAFLYPILLHLYKEFQSGNLGPGVRALILYPMNALANDQRERLGEICKRLQEHNASFRFTFGQYTGETPEDVNDSRRNGQERKVNKLPGEIVFREEMRNSPPHILLTNYSMLEYLLIRPNDCPLFDNGCAQWWNFLVLDEAHQYRGSKGIEMGMLLRRLKGRLREGGRTEPFQCIATSATIAGGEHDKPIVAKFASDLFDENFQAQDVILGTTENVHYDSKEELKGDDYELLQKEMDLPGMHDLSGIASRLGLIISKDMKESYKIGHILKHDLRSNKLCQLIMANPLQVNEIAATLFPGLPDDNRMHALYKLVGLLIKSEDPVSGVSLLSARYHLFLRSLEGVFISYLPEKHILLGRQGITEKTAVFEVAICRECGQHYIVGRLKNGKLYEANRDPGDPDFGATFFMPIDKPIMEDEDEEEDNKEKKLTFKLCIKCGTVTEVKNEKEVIPICKHEQYIFIEQQDSSVEKEDQVPRCNFCGYRAPDPIREIVHGTDGPNAVIATALYQYLPPGRKKILAFSDSRQNAAFFAWYIENSYRDVFNRHLIIDMIRRLGTQTKEGVSLTALADGLYKYYRTENLFPDTVGELELRQEAWKIIYHEFLTDENRISLEGVGLVRWDVKLPEGFKIPSIFYDQPWSLDDREARNLIFVLLNFMRIDKAVELLTPHDVSLNWDDLKVQSQHMRIVFNEKGKLNRDEKRWIGKRGRRVQFLAKFLMNKGLSKEKALDSAIDSLKAVWGAFIKCDENVLSQNKFLIHCQDARRLNPYWWRVFPIMQNEATYQCDVCERFQNVNIGGICLRHKCSGTVHEVQPTNLLNNHYRLLYEDVFPGILRSEEHTAQIDSEKAREFQRAFKKGDINVISSSTTFELGVDLGDLDIIFLRNVPPENFNYTQRVGRAGRRSGFPGFAITFCCRTPHDLYHYAEPDNRILKGNTIAPVIRLRNIKIISRHVAATALSYFFRNSKDRFKNVETFFKNLEIPSGVADFLLFLQENKKKLEESLKKIVPDAVNDELGLNNSSWIEEIAGRNSRLALSEAEISNDFKNVRQLEHNSAAKTDYNTANWAKLRAKTIAGEEILSFLSRKAVIPKYGFPVDVVELDTQKIKSDFNSFEVLLQRDLIMAISEFAPTSRIIANKKEWVSYGLKRVVGKEWPRKFYRRCAKHNLFISWNKGDNEALERCCNNAFDRQYVVPKFGFITNRDKPKEPTKRTYRVFTTRPYFVNLTGTTPSMLDFGVVKLTKTSPGQMVVLCEGRKGEGFYICGACGVGFRDRIRSHKNPYGESCSGTLDNMSLGHEFVTDVLKILFTLDPMQLNDIWFTYSLAYALLEGVTEVLQVPSNDLNVTVSYAGQDIINPIIIYDNVPGGAGFVSRLEEKKIFYACLEAALERVKGVCGCGENESCYGCLRSYRNQFAHHNLKRGPVKKYIEAIRGKWQ